MTKTQNDLVNRALRKLGALPTGQAADPEDFQAVNGTVDSVMSDLATRNVWQWGDPNQVDDDAFEHLAEIVAIANARDFGKDPDEQLRMLMESRLRQLNQTYLSGQRQIAEYF